MNMERIYAALHRIRPYLDVTPVIQSNILQRELDKKIWFKMESQNPTGSFKPRPAFNAILSQLEQAKKRGVIASSSGNFAQGVAYAAARLGVNALIVMTESTSPYKIERTKALGAEVALSGDTHEARIVLTDKLQAETGRVMLHPYDAQDTMEGDATVALELSEQLHENLDHNAAIIVPVSGGGLIAGIAYAIKSLHPTCKVIGVQPKVSGTLAKSLAAGKNVHVGKFKTLADALVASKLGDIPFEIIKDYVDGAILIDENKMKAITQFMLEQHKLVVEPAAALTIAAMSESSLPYDNIICILTGGNIDLKKFYDIK